MACMKTRAIDFVMVNVSDMNRSVEFYRETLGMDFRLTEAHETFTEFDSIPVAFALCETGKNAEWAGGPAVALAVDDIFASVADLKSKGVKILMEPQEAAGCYLAFISDPDGNRICLHQRKDGTAG
jgi:lactoylglutathione lyase